MNHPNPPPPQLEKETLYSRSLNGNDYETLRYQRIFIIEHQKDPVYG